MSLAQTITDQMKEAMKAKDKVKLEAIRSIKSAILMLQTEKGGKGELSADDETKLLQRLQKQRKDSLSIFIEQGRDDLAADEQAQLAVIESFLPKQMDTAELKEYLSELITKLGATGPKDMGKIMGMASKDLGAKADGKTISTLAKELLS